MTDGITTRFAIFVYCPPAPSPPSPARLRVRLGSGSAARFLPNGVTSDGAWQADVPTPATAPFTDCHRHRPRHHRRRIEPTPAGPPPSLVTLAQLPAGPCRQRRDGQSLCCRHRKKPHPKGRIAAASPPLAGARSHSGAGRAHFSWATAADGVATSTSPTSNHTIPKYRHRHRRGHHAGRRAPRDRLPGMRRRRRRRRGTFSRHRRSRHHPEICDCDRRYCRGRRGPERQRRRGRARTRASPGPAALTGGQPHVAHIRQRNHPGSIVIATGALSPPSRAPWANRGKWVDDWRKVPRLAGIASDGAGNLFVADSGNETIRKIVIATGAVTTLRRAPGQTGSARDGTGAARFDVPLGIASDGRDA